MSAITQPAAVILLELMHNLGKYREYQLTLVDKRWREVTPK